MNSATCRNLVTRSFGSLLTLALSLVFAPDLAGQGVSQGLMLGAPMTVFVKQGTLSSTGALDEFRLHRKPVGYVPFADDAPPSVIMTPDFRSAVLFGDGVNPPPFEVNAISMGIEILPVSQPSFGVSMVTLGTPLDWGMFTFSVSRSSQGLPGSPVALERAQPGGAAADLFTYILPGSDFDPDVAPSYKPDTVLRSVDALEMDLSDGVSIGEISAMDFSLGLYETGDPLADPLNGLLPTEPTVYFSISRDDIFPIISSPVNPAWFGGIANMSSASILSTTWDSAALSWSPPTVFRTFVELGLAKNNDIDSLAVDAASCKALFSIRRTPTTSLANQLQVVGWCGSDDGGTGIITVGDLYANDGTTTSSVASRMALEDDDEIDGLCVQDPGLQILTLSAAYGKPVGAVTNTVALAASIFRDDTGSAPRLTLMVEKLPTMGPIKFLAVMIALPSAGVLVGPIILDTVGAGSLETYRQFTFEHPSFGLWLGDKMQVFFLVGGAGPPLVSSPVLEIGI